MKTWEQFISEITDAEGAQIMSEYKHLKKTGTIGMSILRDKADQWKINLDINSVNVIVTMDMIHHEITTRFANAYLNYLESIGVVK